ncbi:MAG TPA: substrate-binding domain-containing protein [Pseudolabrys sp.]|nr:substrate-binding domain-containing protein [Pseudolabrys sp.]
MMSTTLRRAAPSIAAALLSLSLLAGSGAARADEIKVMASVALKSTLDDLAAKFEKSGGGKVTMVYGLAAQLKQRVADGEADDVAVLIRPMMDDLLKQGKLAAGSLTNVGGTPVAIAIRAGAPKPDISTVDALKRTLLAAKSISYSDPAKGGASGVYFAKVVDQLGLTEQLKAKTILVPGAQAPERVAAGEAELGVAQGSEIIPVAGAQLLGPLPGNLGSVTLFTAGIAAVSKAPETAKAFIKFITGPEVAPVLKAKGFQPGG